MPSARRDALASSASHARRSRHDAQLGTPPVWAVRCPRVGHAFPCPQNRSRARGGSEHGGARGLRSPEDASRAWWGARSWRCECDGIETAALRDVRQRHACPLVAKRVLTRADTPQGTTDSTLRLTAGSIASVAGRRSSQRSPSPPPKSKAGRQNAVVRSWVPSLAVWFHRPRRPAASLAHL